MFTDDICMYVRDVDVYGRRCGVHERRLLAETRYRRALQPGRHRRLDRPTASHRCALCQLRLRSVLRSVFAEYAYLFDLQPVT